MLEYAAHLSLTTFKPNLVFTTYEVNHDDFLRIDLMIFKLLGNYKEKDP